MSQIDTTYWILAGFSTCKAILPKFISMESNLTATIIIYIFIWMDQPKWHTMYKTKPSTQTDILPQQKLFLCGLCCVKQNSVSVVYAQDWN